MAGYVGNGERGFECVGESETQKLKLHKHLNWTTIGIRSALSNRIIVIFSYGQGWASLLRKYFGLCYKKIKVRNYMSTFPTNLEGFT